MMGLRARRPARRTTRGWIVRRRPRRSMGAKAPPAPAAVRLAVRRKAWTTIVRCSPTAKAALVRGAKAVPVPKIDPVPKVAPVPKAVRCKARHAVPTRIGRRWKSADPEMFKILKQEMDLQRQTSDLANDYRQAAGSKRDEIKTQIEKLVDQQFEVRQQCRQLELNRFEEDLKRLRESIETRNKARKQVVQRRVAELLGQDDTGF